MVIMKRYRDDNVTEEYAMELHYARIQLFWSVKLVPLLLYKIEFRLYCMNDHVHVSPDVIKYFLYKVEWMWYTVCPCA